MIFVVAIAVAKFLLHLYFNSRYGYFRDEFDYIACGAHPAWGYVDHPPLIPMLVRLSRMLLGDSLRSIRFVPALASSALVVLAGMIAREFGARRYALILTALSVALAPMYLSDGSLMTTNCLEPLLWMGCAYCAILAVKRDDPRWWLPFGVVAGIGLEEKYSIALFGAGMIVGLVLTPQRRFLASKWLWLGGLAAGLVFLPNLLWNVANHWPFLELMHNIRANSRDVVLSPLAYFSQQFLLLGFLNTPIWLAGLFALFFWRPLRPYRMLGWCYLVVFTAFGVVLHGKNYYLTPIYPMLLAAGAVAIEHSLARTGRWEPWLQSATAGVLAATGIWLAPIVIPVFSPEHFMVYLHSLPFSIPVTEHGMERVPLPQHYADQFGWQELADLVNTTWQRIPAPERSDCAIFGKNYGEAGAIDFLGRRYGLPAAISGHQSYYLWGPRGYSGDCMIVMGERRSRLEPLFEGVDYAGTTDSPYAEQPHIDVFVCRGAKFGTLAALWPTVKDWD